MIYPNVRGSSGYGKTFVGLDDGFKREDSYKGLSARCWIGSPRSRVWTPAAILVTGGSYGGHMTLAVHDLETILEAFDKAKDDPTPHAFVAYTIKGYGLPLAGHKDNHAGLMNPTQLAAFRERCGVAEGEEWSALAGLSRSMIEPVKRQIAAAPILGRTPPATDGVYRRSHPADADGR